MRHHFNARAHISDCPGASVAYIGMSGQPQTCKPDALDACKPGFTCQLTRRGNRHVCCTTIEPHSAGVKPSSVSTGDGGGGGGGETVGHTQQEEEGGEAGGVSSSLALAPSTTTHTPTRVRTNCQTNERLLNGICMCARKLACGAD